MTTKQEELFLSEDSRYLEKFFPNSTTVFKAKYDTVRMVLLIEYTTGEIYEYNGIPRIYVDDFYSATSPGKYINSFLKKLKTNYRKVNEFYI